MITMCDQKHITAYFSRNKIVMVFGRITINVDSTINRYMLMRLADNTAQIYTVIKLCHSTQLFRSILSGLSACAHTRTHSMQCNHLARIIRCLHFCAVESTFCA